jgi:hypothetical protein
MLFTLTTAAAIALTPEQPGVRVFAGDLAGFCAASPQGRVSLSLEGVPAGSEMPSRPLPGVWFSATGAGLVVVSADETSSPDLFFEDVHTFPLGKDEAAAMTPETRRVDASLSRLPATTGEHILSPGGKVLGPGPDPKIEEDDLTIAFDPPARAVGFDLLTQSRDGQSQVGIRILDARGGVLFEGDVPIGHSQGHAGGADFWGVVCGAALIARVEIDERDSNDRYPDCNIGFDSFRIVPQPLPADADGSGVVGSEDVAYFRRLFEAGSAAADLNADGRVDEGDLAVFRSLAASAMR